MVSDTFPFKKNLLKKIQLLSSLMDSNMKYLLFILLILFCSCYSGSSKKGQELYALHKYVDSIIKTDTILQQRFHCFGAGLTKDKISIDWRTNSKGDFGYKISTRYCCITCKKKLFFHANSLFFT